MKKVLTFSAISVLVFSILLINSGCTKIGLENEKDKISYSIGWDVGSSFKKQSIDIDTDAFLMGLKDASAGSESLLTEEQMRDIMMSFQRELQTKQMEAKEQMREKNKEEGEEFLAINKKRKDVKTTSNGLQYRVIKKGKGKKPKPTDTVVVNYSGTLIDGTEFDSSYKRGTPATFRVNAVIRGWTEALQLMNEGSTYELFIPSELAYGERGAGNTIGPNATLIFTVELVEIQK